MCGRNDSSRELGHRWWKQAKPREVRHTTRSRGTTRHDTAEASRGMPRNREFRVRGRERERGMAKEGGRKMERKNGWGGEGIDGDGRAEIDKVAPS